jgi:DNA repair exonuclease SbcCD ATPase subunit
MATIVEAEIKLTAEKAIKQVKELKLELEEVKKELKANEQTQKKAEKSSRSFGKALGAIGKAGGVIFLLQKAFELLKGAIESNQQVADTFKVVMGTISQVFTEIAGVLVGVYNNITATSDGFDALGKVVSGIIDVALTPFKLIWDGIKLKLLEAQLAWEESFFGSGNTETIDRLNDSIKQTRQDIGETLDVGAEGLTNIVENFGEAVSEVGEAGSQVIEGVSKISIKSIADNVKANVQLKKASERARIENQGLIEQYDRQAEQQRQIRDNDLKNIDDRIKANDELKKTLEDQKEKMLENVDLMIQQAQAQFDLTGKEEDFLALQSAKNEQQANDQEQKKIDKDLGKAKEGQMKETLGNIATIVGKNSKFGKAIAIVQALQDTYAGANKALAQGGIFGFIGAAAVIAGGIANVKKIASSKSPKPPAGLGARDTGGEPTPSIPSSASASIPPEFSTVGASGTNQLANLLGNQPPVQAFVVSGDVTTAQELDRNIISSASIG